MAALLYPGGENWKALLKKGAFLTMKKHRNSFHIRVTALLLALLCIAGLFPTQAMAVGDTIKLDSFGMSGVAYESAALGRCSLHQMFYASGSETVAGFAVRRAAVWANPSSARPGDIKRPSPIPRYL